MLENSQNDPNSIPDNETNKLKGSGEIDLKGTLDNTGYYLYDYSKYMAGVKVHIKWWITSPDDVYHVKITTNYPETVEWYNVHPNETKEFTMNTNVFSKTSLKVEIWAAKSKNCDVNAVLWYSY